MALRFSFCHGFRDPNADTDKGRRLWESGLFLTKQKAGNTKLNSQETEQTVKEGHGVVTARIWPRLRETTELKYSGEPIGERQELRVKRETMREKKQNYEKDK